MSLSSHDDLGWVWIGSKVCMMYWEGHWLRITNSLSKVLCFCNYQSRMLACPESILTFSHRGGFCELLSLFLWDAFRLTGMHFLFTDEIQDPVQDTAWHLVLNTIKVLSNSVGSAGWRWGVGPLSLTYKIQIFGLSEQNWILISIWSRDVYRCQDTVQEKPT